MISGSPAEKSGIKIGDIITEIGGNKLTDSSDTSLIELINKRKIGDKVEIKLWRDGKEQSVTVTLEKRSQ